jgi:hypothetical protein
VRRERGKIVAVRGDEHRIESIRGIPFDCSIALRGMRIDLVRGTEIIPDVLVRVGTRRPNDVISRSAA